MIGITAALGSAASWAAGSFLFKRIGKGVSPFGMTLVKGVIGIVFLIAALSFTGFRTIETESVLFLSLSGLLGIAVADTLFFAALQDLGPVTIVVFFMMGQIVTALMALFWLGEMPSVQSWVGICVTLAGVGAVLWPKFGSNASLKRSGIRGVILGSVSMLCMSASTVVAKPALGSVSTIMIVKKAYSRLFDYQQLKDAGLISWGDDFYPAGVHYPPITRYPPISKNEMVGTYRAPTDEKFDVYVHIPFCRKRCIFCHYPSLYGASDAEKDDYLDHLEKEIEIVTRQIKVKRIKARSILVGGGTPTDLTPKQLKRLLGFICTRLDMGEIEQFNFDVDPSTLVGAEGIERLRIMRDFGVDRQTIGIQSLDDAVLKKMNRSHDSAVALKSIKNCMDMGYQVNIEFIFGYPGQTIQSWIDTIDSALVTGVHEIQFYRLKIDPYGDQTGKIVNVRKNRPDTLPSAQETILMKQIAIDLLAESGYRENLRRVFTEVKNIYPNMRSTSAAICWTRSASACPLSAVYAIDLY